MAADDAPTQISLADVDAHRTHALEGTVRTLQANLTDQLNVAAGFRQVVGQLQEQLRAERALHVRRVMETEERGHRVVNQIAEDMQKQIDALRAENAELKARLANVAEAVPVGPANSSEVTA